MNMNFSQRWPRRMDQYSGLPTRFKELILSGVKTHTFRVDQHKLWHKGRKIEMVINPYNKFREVFNSERPDLQVCQEVQVLKIKNEPNYQFPRLTIYSIEGHLVHQFSTKEEFDRFAFNDGFTNGDHLTLWIESQLGDFANKSFRLIHFSNKNIYGS